MSKKRTKSKKKNQKEKKDNPNVFAEIDDQIIKNIALKLSTETEDVRLSSVKKLLRKNSFSSGSKNQENEPLLYPNNLLIEFVKNAEPLKLIEYWKYMKLSTNKWYDDDLCFCESNKNIWKCHLANLEGAPVIQDLELTNSIKETLYKKIDYSNVCLYDECNEKAINSHIIPKNILKKVEKEFIKVDMFENEKMNEKFNKKQTPNNIVAKIFCKKHDQELFKKVDSAPFNLTITNLKMATIRSAYKELHEKKSVVQQMRKMMEKNIKTASMPFVIEQYKGNKLGARDIEENIKNFMNPNNELIIFKIVKTVNKFCTWTYANPKRYSEDGKKVQNESWNKDIYEKTIYPGIATVAFPWTNEHMIFIVLFADFRKLKKEYKFVVNLNDDELQKWVSAQIADGANLFANKATYEKFQKNGFLEKFKILNSPFAFTGLSATRENTYENTLNIFKD